MKSVKYHTVGTFPKSTRKIVETQTKSIFLAHKYTTYFPGEEYVLQ
jgi:hypothetical protein